MASRRNDRESSSLGRKLLTWTIIALIIVWAAHNPTQAAAIVHSIASAIANMASRYGKHSH